MNSDSNVPPNSSLPSIKMRIIAFLKRCISSMVLLLGIILLLNLNYFLDAHPYFPDQGQSLNYALLFIAGLLTSFHCVGMCGALVVSYVVKSASENHSKYVSHLFYGLGKLLSYTVIGGLFGILGAIITFTPFMRGLAGIGAGIFLLLFGLSSLHIFPILNRFRLKTPDFIMKRLGKAYRSQQNHPFFIGLLNGLMIICGPLQAMYILAAGTGSPLEGATLLFFFGLGTLPMMLGFGLLASALSKQFAPKIIRLSGIIVIGLGVLMINRGLSMVGGYDYHSLMSHQSQGENHTAHCIVPDQDKQVIHMTVDRDGYTPSEFYIRKGIPVHWVIYVKEIDYSTHRLVVPSLQLENDLHQGENKMEFTLNTIGSIPWSNWTGSFHGTFFVYEEPPVEGNTHPLAHEHQREHGQEGHEGHRESSRPEWMKNILEKSAAAIEMLRKNLHP